ncbi:MAG: hypothetical protein M1826_002217 [Phylliscum demangeonii]|nr:MAG: hypothetical protein M1826_002217 [Phylliscum demangeonii]
MARMRTNMIEGQELVSCPATDTIDQAAGPLYWPDSLPVVALEHEEGEKVLRRARRRIRREVCKRGGQVPSPTLEEAPKEDCPRPDCQAVRRERVLLDRRLQQARRQANGDKGRDHGKWASTKERYDRINNLYRKRWARQCNQNRKQERRHQEEIRNLRERLQQLERALQRAGVMAFIAWISLFQISSSSCSSFMLPLPIDPFQKNSFTKRAPETADYDRQHGFHDDFELAAHLPLAEGRVEPPSLPTSSSVESSSPACWFLPIERHGSRLNAVPSSLRSQPRDDSNTDVEVALAHSSSPPDTPEADVAASGLQFQLTDNEQNSAFANLPNDVLQSGTNRSDFPQSQASHASIGLGVPAKRRFSRLTALASWRSEYMIRIRLLRSLARGKPAQMSEQSASSTKSRSSFDIGTQAAITYSSGVYMPITHMHACFELARSRKIPRFVLGADEIGWARRTDVSHGRVDNWGSSDPQTFLQFEERFPGDPLWGLGAGNSVGVPNVMDLSQPFGMVYGEGSPGGLVYFRSTDELRGRYLSFPKSESAPHLGIPKILVASEAICSVWIAKSTNLVSLSGGLVGILSGSSSGVVTSYSLGTDGLQDERLGRGEVTGYWAVSPGVPIISIVVDDQYSVGRQRERRSWVVVLNALGEVYYLTGLPTRAKFDARATPNDDGLEHLAWKTGRSVGWRLIEQTSRARRPNPYDELRADSTDPPTASMNLTGEQLVAYVREIEKNLRHPPKHFRDYFQGWDMKRKLEVDFANGGSSSGESVLVINRGHGLREPAKIKRFTRCWTIVGTGSGEENTNFSKTGRASRSSTAATSSKTSSRASSSSVCSEGVKPYQEEWRTADLLFGASKAEEITASALDHSTFALLTVAEDPLLNPSASSATSSPISSPTQAPSPPLSISTTPGQRARFLAVGTKGGSIILWDVRESIGRSREITKELLPLRIIHTDSPQISCLALTALYMVHGGNDGLVQAWDPLASSTQPIRTLNSRFSSRARRRLLQQAQGPTSVHPHHDDDGSGEINMYGAGAISLDPDPTVLRGMVSLGAHVRYWSYSSSAASQYAGRKRRQRRRHNFGASGPRSFSGPTTGRNASLHDYISTERVELERDRDQERKEADRLTGRFGVGLLGQGADDDDDLAYAKMLSEETFALEADERRRSEPEAGTSRSTNGSVAVASSSSSSSSANRGRRHVEEEDDDNDDEASTDRELAWAVQQSLAAHPSTSSSANLGSVLAGPSSSASSSARVYPAPSPPPPATDDLDLDLAYVLQLSLAEEDSRRAAAAAAAALAFAAEQAACDGADPDRLG